MHYFRQHWLSSHWRQLSREYLLKISKFDSLKFWIRLAINLILNCYKSDDWLISMRLWVHLTINYYYSDNPLPWCLLAQKYIVQMITIRFLALKFHYVCFLILIFNLIMYPCNNLDCFSQKWLATKLGHQFPSCYLPVFCALVLPLDGVFLTKPTCQVSGA